MSSFFSNSWLSRVSGTAAEESGDGLRGPIFLAEPPERVVIANTVGAAVPCAVYGNPPPAVTWITDDDGQQVGAGIRCLEMHTWWNTPCAERVWQAGGRLVHRSIEDKTSYIPLILTLYFSQNFTKR